MRAAGTVSGMTQGHESRWSLAHTGNRVLLAVVVGVLLQCLCGSADLPAGARVAILLAAAGVTYVLVTLLHRSRR